MLTAVHATAAAVFIVIAGAACAYVGRREPLATFALACLCFAWFAVDNAWEGAVLLPVATGHGLTVSDLPGVAGLVLAAFLWFRRRRS